MQNEIFEHYFPMPDDIAQSILIAETESKIHLRPINLNAKKVWLYNKLLKNLLTNRKTILQIDNQTDALLITEFLEEIGLDKLCFSFTHSRSNNEKKLKEFEPIIVNGIINPDSFGIAVKHLMKSYTEVLRSYNAYYQKDILLQENLSSYIQKSIRIRQNLIPYEGFQSDFSKLSQKDFISLKRNLKEAIELSKGSNPFLSVFQIINKKIFELFNEEEAWLTISEHLNSLKESVVPILSTIQFIKEQFVERLICDQQKAILSHFNLFVNLNSKSVLDSEEEIQLSLITAKLTSSISQLSKDESLVQIENLKKLNIHQLLHLIAMHAQEKWNSESCTLFNGQSMDKLSTDLVFQARSLIYKLNHSGIFEIRIIEFLSIQHIKSILLDLRKEAELVLSLKSYFSLFYSWKKYLLNCTENQQQFLQELTVLPSSQWQLLLELSHTEKLIEQGHLFDAISLNERLDGFNQSLEQYKKELIKTLAAKYEKQQHSQLEEIKNNQPELKKLIIDRAFSELSLSDYYTRIPLLAELFPIIILENTKLDYFPSIANKIWDELIILDDSSTNVNIHKLIGSAYHIIQLQETPSNDVFFNIALTQSAPEKLKNILFETHHSESFTTIQQLSNFIFSNKPSFTVLLNSDELIISFLTLSMTKLMLNLHENEYNIFSISESKDFERFNDWLMYKPTKKIIWTMDNLINTESLSIQQLSWQKHFIKCLKVAGFQIENFSSEILLNIRNIWEFPNRNSLYYNSIERSSEVHA
ncbi:MAG: hypothetical protein ABI851_10025 [Saprospiraceae bacterium]